ncbi:MAG: hypothetical protein JW810_06710 [Sedimentisphaerales bacterium]|nr:hypothetical protein [Sedimentisphaerales bacterium]
MNTKRLICLFFLCHLISGQYAGIVSAAESSRYLDRLRKFDISCRFTDERTKKKEVGLEHRAAFSALIRQDDKEATLKIVEREQIKSKDRLKRIEEWLRTAPAADNTTTRLCEELVAKALQKDAGALEQLKAIGPAAIPALVDLKQDQFALPTPEVIHLLSQGERQADRLLESNSSGLDAQTLGDLAQRERNYGEILKRAVIALEGTRRDYPHWLPFVYLYGLGFVPFLFGIIASVIYYGGFRWQAMTIIAGSYLFYVCLTGFFQFVAPWIG